MTARAAALLVFPLLVFQLASQDFSAVQVEKAAHGLRFTQGPVWSHEGYLLFTDVPGGKIMKLPAEGDPQLFRDSSNGAAGMAFDSQGRLYICETHVRRVTRTDKKGQIEVLADKWEGKRLNAPHDIVVAKSGHVYFTDPAFGSQQDSRELDFYGVYHITPKGRLSVASRSAGRPNGITLSPDGRVLYVTNSDERNIRAYDVDREGELSAERIIISGVDGIPAGLRADAQGNLYVAAKGIAVYSPEGKLLATIPIAEKPSNCAFGDPDLQTLYITARTSVYRLHLDLKGAALN